MLGGAVGGNLLGFTAGCVSPDERAILGIGYGGSFHMYVRKAASMGVNASGGHGVVPVFPPLAEGIEGNEGWTEEGAVAVETQYERRSPAIQGSKGVRWTATPSLTGTR